MALGIGLTIWVIGTLVLLLAVWQARPAARWTATRQQVFADLVERASAKKAPDLIPTLEVAVAEVTRSVAPSKHVVTGAHRSRRTLARPVP